MLRNLSRRPPKPAMGNGRLQRAARRAFLVYDAPSRPVLNDEWLAQALRQPMTHQACEDVGRPASGKADNDAHRPRRIGLRLRDARDNRQRGSARGQMQKLSAGKFHRALPRTMGYENGLLRFDAGLLDDRPPFLDLGLLIGTKRLRRLPLALRNLKALLGEA